MLFLFTSSPTCVRYGRGLASDGFPAAERTSLWPRSGQAVKCGDSDGAIRRITALSASVRSSRVHGYGKPHDLSRGRLTDQSPIIRWRRSCERSRDKEVSAFPVLRLRERSPQPASPIFQLKRPRPSSRSPALGAAVQATRPPTWAYCRATTQVAQME